MEIKRDSYLNQLIAYKFNGLVKVITGIRRSGKSYLLNKLYRNHLLKSGVTEDQIISIELDLTKDIKYRNPLELASYVRELLSNKDQLYYLFIDEIQMSDVVTNPYNPDGAKISFYDALNDLNSIANLDIYVTGSNSKLLSSDILTQFRGRSEEVRVHPLSFSEYFSAVGGDSLVAFNDYIVYGGMPLIISRPNDAAKMHYLKSLFSEVYIKDIVERRKIERQDVLEHIIDLLCSSVGSLTNPNKISNTLKSTLNIDVSSNTIRTYIKHLQDAFLFSESKRYDVKGKSYFDFPNKYYVEDIGLRNAKLGFRQQEITHIMENVIYNELIFKGFSVDVGVVFERAINKNANSVRLPREIDFIATLGGKKVYIQSAYIMDNEEKQHIEKRPFSLVQDSFPKIIIRRDVGKRWYDNDGVLQINIIDFLLDNNLL